MVLKEPPSKNKLNYRYLKTETHHDLFQVIGPRVKLDHNITPHGVYDDPQAFWCGTLRAGLLKPEGGLTNDRGEGVTHVVHTTLEELVAEFLQGIAAFK
jgi:hypothetical protein